MMTKRSKYILTTCLIAFAIFLRVVNLAHTPIEMHVDEAGLGLNAWSIANYGTDRYGHFLPVCPSNFYGEQSAFYTYFGALFVKFFGLNIYTLRLPGAIIGILTVIFGALIMKEKWGDKGFFTGLTFLTIFPYFIMNSRFAYDCNAMLGTLTIALYALLRLLQKVNQNSKQKLYAYFALTGFLFGIVLYTYIVAAIVIALFCILFGLYYLFYQKENRLLRLKQLIFMACPLLLMSIPLVLVFCVNYFNLEPIVTPIFTIPKMIVNRTEEINFSLSSMLKKTRNLLYPLTSDGKYGSSDRYWTMYHISVAFILFGAIKSIISVFRSKKDAIDCNIIMVFISIAEVIMFMLCGIYTYHINGIMIALVYYCINGIFSIKDYLSGRKSSIAYISILAIAYFVYFLSFCSDYYFKSPENAYRVYNGANEALSLLSDRQKQGEIYILDEVGEFYFLSNPISPTEFSSSCDELGLIKDYKNIHFHEPETYNTEDVIVCNKASGVVYSLKDSSFTGVDFSYMETGHYYVFYVER